MHLKPKSFDCVVGATTHGTVSISGYYQASVDKKTDDDALIVQHAHDKLCWKKSILFYNKISFPAPFSPCLPLAFLSQIKPDGVQRGIVGNIISRFETKGYKLVAMKTKQATKELLEQHYKDLVEKVRACA